MTIERTLIIEGKEYPLTLSDEPKTLLAAKAAGRVVVGIKEYEEACAGKTAGREAVNSEDKTDAGSDSAPWLPADYVTAALPVDETWLEGVARRELGIPWRIAETDRLLIREFSLEDIPYIPSDADDSPDEAILKDPERLQAYIKEQYAFFDCGMWAVVRKEDGKIVGMVSLTPDTEFDSLLNISAPETKDNGYMAGKISDLKQEGVCALGYHIYAPYRRLGYAKEACKGITDLLAHRRIAVSVYTDPANTASLALLKALGFVKVGAPFNCFLHCDFI